MTSLLATLAKDKSTYMVTAAFTDQDGVAITPDTVAWSLMDNAGTIINNREAVSITPATSVTIVLSGADIDYDDGYRRVLEVYAVYDSVLGNDLPIRDAVVFDIENLFNEDTVPVP